ncbi:HIP1.2 family protein [Megaselia abdita]
MECSTLWEMLKRQPLMEQRFTAWKFCHLLHKVLREGHQSIIKVSYSNRTLIAQIGAMWVHLNDGVGVCIEMYTKLLVTKIEFHKRNTAIPGNLVLEFNELEKYAHNDINYYFELGVEVFDYLDDILFLQTKVFLNINMFRMSSMTPQGQCRLAPLIPLIQDSNQLYDLIVRLMFKLHANLPNDILQGHRERFRIIFCKLKEFYNTVKPLAYFSDLLQVPVLPETAPNFSSKVDFGSYVPPVVIVPEPVAENLVDTNIPATTIIQQQINETEERLKAEYEQELWNKDQYIQKMQGEIQNIRSNNLALLNSQKEEIDNLKIQNQALSGQLSMIENDMMEKQIMNSKLESSANSISTLEEKIQTEAKIAEDKFLKIKSCYGQIRDEHVQLLRKNAETTKQNSILQSDIMKINTENELLKSQIEEYNSKEKQTEIVFKQSLETQEKLEALKEEFDSLRAAKEAEIMEKCNKYEASALEENKKIIEKENECKELTEININLQKEIHDLKNEHNLLKEHFDLLQTNHKALESANNVEQSNLMIKKVEIKNLNEQYEILLTENKLKEERFKTHLDELSEKYDSKETECNELLSKLEINKQDKSDLVNQIELNTNNYRALLSTHEELRTSTEMYTTQLHEKQLEYESLEKQYNQLIIDSQEQEKSFKLTISNLDRLVNEKSIIENEFQDLLHQQHEMENRLMLKDKTILELQSGICALLKSVISSSEQLTFDYESDLHQIFTELIIKIKELSSAFNNYEQNPTLYVECLGRKVITAGHFLGLLQKRGLEICNNCPDIQAGEKIAEEFHSFQNDINQLFDSIKALKPYEETNVQFNRLLTKLDELSKMSQTLTPTDNIGQISDQLEMELASMDKAIEEASQRISSMLLNSRSQDTGIMLEVNERILDSCTKLIQSIMVLVKKSRLLQSEIVNSGKGSASAKDFYKRNNQWTDGLISAAKNVGIGANLLVEAANKVVSGEIKHRFDIIAATQEIAASTAQLVVASRVKAPKESTNLLELSRASKTVTQATGEVVATVKDCSQRLDNNEDFDITKLTVHQVKTMEIEIQVKVLELEQSLQMERQKLAAFRRKSYNLIDDN